MPRIRTIKPEFWADEKLSLLDPTTRLVFLGLISMADDAGRLIDNVKLLDGQLFPSTDDTCRDALDALARLSRITRYVSASGQAIIQVTKWEQHQRVDHPNKHVLPGPSEAVVSQPVVPEASTNGNGAHSRKAREHVASVSRNPRATTLDLRPTTSTNDLTHTAPDGARVIRDEAFERAWALYPKRAGSNPRRDAEHAWNARLRDGEDPEAMTHGVARYRQFLEVNGQIGTQFVMQGKRFFGPAKPYAEPWDTPADPAELAAEAMRKQQDDDQLWIAERRRDPATETVK